MIMMRVIVVVEIEIIQLIHLQMIQAMQHIFIQIPVLILVSHHQISIHPVNLGKCGHQPILQSIPLLLAD